MNKDNKAISKKKEAQLTEQNWAMLKHIENGKKIKDAYKLAGYTGTHPHEAYQMYYRVKKKLEAVYEADNIDSLRLKIAAKKILDMKVEDKPIRPEVKLRAIETLAKLTEKAKTEIKTISPFIIQKFESGSKNEIQTNKDKIIDIKPIKIESDS
jgi:translation initiation factor IF-3